MTARCLQVLVVAGCVAAGVSAVSGQVIKAPAVDKWVTVTGKAAGTNLTAQDEAIAKALRRAVEVARGM